MSGVREAIDYLIGEYERADKRDVDLIRDIKEDLKAIIRYQVEDIPEDLTERMWEILNSKERGK